MSAEYDSAVDPHPEHDLECWCCGSIDAPSQLVQLGKHPEVQLCLGCAHSVHQRAREIEDAGRRGTAALARGQVRNLRAIVVQRGWHRNKVIGGALRWVGRYLP